MNEVTDATPEMTENAIHVARNTPYLSRPVTSWATTAAAAGLLLGLVGATGSYEYSALFRLAVWLPLSLIAGLIGLALETLFTRFDLDRRGWILWWFASALAMATLMLPIVYFANSLGGPKPLSMVQVYAANCVIISSGFVALRMIVGSSLANVNEPKPTNSDAAGSTPILLRLKPALRDAQLFALKSEGHYVLVITDQGEELVLMRFRDALLETNKVAGMQVHRSWWIAKNALERSERRSDTILAILKSGQQVPISRNFRKEWRSAAWSQATP